MTNSMPRETFFERVKIWLPPCLAIALTGCGLYLLASANLSVNGLLDKPIPTGSIGELLAYASGALLIASLLVCGAFAVYLNVRIARRMRAEQKAKAMARDLIQRISAKEAAYGVMPRLPVKIMH